MESMELVNLIKNIISLKTQTTDIEFKKASKVVPEKLYDTFSSFSNTSGGIIIFGIDEKMDIRLQESPIKIPFKKELLNNLF